MDAMGNSSFFGYDEMNRLISVSLRLKKVTTLNSNLKKRISIFIIIIAMIGIVIFVFAFSSILFGDRIDIPVSGMTIATGGTSSYVIKPNGTLWSWGGNEFGQVGNGTNETQYSPVRIMRSVVAVSAGNSNTLALRSDGSVWSWGMRSEQMYNVSDVSHLAPVRILDNVKHISTSNTHRVAIKTDGSLWTWGTPYGFTRDGHFVARYSTPIHKMDDVVYASAGFDYTAAIKKDGSLWTWGRGRIEPQQMMEDVKHVSVGHEYVLVIKNDGSLWAWGCNRFGQLQGGFTPESYFIERYYAQGYPRHRAVNIPIKIMESVMMPVSRIINSDN